MNEIILMGRKKVKNKDFAKLSYEKIGVTKDEQFLRNLATWIIENTGNVEVAGRLSLIASWFDNFYKKEKEV